MAIQWTNGSTWVWLFIVPLLYLVVVVLYSRHYQPSAIIIKQKLPPEELSPAVVACFLAGNHYPPRLLAITLLSLAVRGYLSITTQAGSYTLTKCRRVPGDLSSLLLAHLEPGQPITWTTLIARTHFSRELLTSILAGLEAAGFILAYDESTVQLLDKPLIADNMQLLPREESAVLNYLLPYSGFTLALTAETARTIRGAFDHLKYAIEDRFHVEDFTIKDALYFSVGVVLALAYLVILGRSMFGIFSLRTGAFLLSMLPFGFAWYFIMMRASLSRATLDAILGFRKELLENETTPATDQTDQFFQYLPYAVAYELSVEWERYCGLRPEAALAFPVWFSATQPRERANEVSRIISQDFPAVLEQLIAKVPDPVVPLPAIKSGKPRFFLPELSDVLARWYKR